MGKKIYLIFLFFISVKFDLFKKKGQVAPKCVSARINNVVKIKIFSYWGNLNKINPTQDFEVELDDNLRLKIDTTIVPDGIEKNNSKQAF